METKKLEPMSTFCGHVGVEHGEEPYGNRVVMLTFGSIAADGTFTTVAYTYATPDHARMLAKMIIDAADRAAATFST